MARILRTYVIREVAVPTLLALLTITFVLLIQVIQDLIDLLLMPGVYAGQVIEVLASFLPSLIAFATPMAILIGVLISVGRLTMDNEVLAIRASGINLVSIFWPAMRLALVVSLVLMGLSGGLIPRMMLRGFTRVNELQMSLINSLEPGRWYDELGGEGDPVIYFRARDPQTQQMKGVTLKLETEVEREEAVTTTSEQTEPTTATLDDRRGRRSHTDVTSTQKGTLTDAEFTTQPYLNPPEGLLGRENEQTLVFAETGEIRTELLDPLQSGEREAVIMLSLLNGSIHRFDPNPQSRDYVSIRFDTFETKLLRSVRVKQKRLKASTNAQLRERLDDPTLVKASLRGQVRRMLYRRYSISLASFVFVLVGIPLAIWVRPSGKSWGIMIAVGLMLIYYVLMRWGLSMVETDKPLGALVAFSPNLLFLALGGGLWWQTLRS